LANDRHSWCYVVNARRRTHILSGDETGGGHRFGAGRGKSEFPRDWPDDRIIEAIEAVANGTLSIMMPSRGGRVIMTGVWCDVGITVVVNPRTREIVTGYPADLGHMMRIKRD
jgi:hypothetical protein